MNFGIMLPAVILIFYVIPHLAGEIYIVPFAILISVPVVSVFVPRRFRTMVNPAVILAILLVILLSLAVLAGRSTTGTFLTPLSNYVEKNRLLKYLVIPFNLKTGITFSMVISVTAAMGGIKSRTLNRAVSYLVLSLLPLLDQVFVLYLMQIYNYSYSSAYLQAYEMQLLSWIALIFTGSTNIDGQSFPPPLQKYNFPVDPAMMISLIVSLISIIAYFILTQDRQLRPSALAGIGSAVLLGGILAFLVFAIDQLVSGMGFQILVVAIAVLATAIYAVRSAPERKLKKQGKLPREDRW